MSTTRQSATTDQPNRRKARFADGGEVQSPEDEYRNAWQSGADDDQGDIAQHAAYAIGRQAAQDTDAHSGSVAGHAAYAIGNGVGAKLKADKSRTGSSTSDLAYAMGRDAGLTLNAGDSHIKGKDKDGATSSAVAYAMGNAAASQMGGDGKRSAPGGDMPSSVAYASGREFSEAWNKAANADPAPEPVKRMGRRTMKANTGR